MEDVLTGVGLTPKESRVYLLLLEQGRQTAAQLVAASGEKRPNVYALLDSLLEKGLIVSDDNNAVRRFRTADPNNLQRIVQSQQASYLQAVGALKAVMPNLRSQHSLTTDKPGVIYMAGSDGLLRLLDDMANSQTEVLLVASDQADVENIVGFKERLLKRHKNGVLTRAIAHDADRDTRRTMYAERGMELRFMGEIPFTGEVVIYEDNVAFTVYEPSIITTVVTNKLITETMRMLFEELWVKAVRD